MDGTSILALFSNVGTLLSIMFDGDEGLLISYKNVDFLKPVHTGEFLDARAKITGVGNTSRTIVAEVWRIVKSAGIPEAPSAADYLNEPELIAKAEIVGVVPKSRQRLNE